MSWHREPGDTHAWCPVGDAIIHEVGDIFSRARYLLPYSVTLRHMPSTAKESPRKSGFDSVSLYDGRPPSNMSLADCPKGSLHSGQIVGMGPSHRKSCTGSVGLAWHVARLARSASIISFHDEALILRSGFVIALWLNAALNAR